MEMQSLLHVLADLPGLLRRGAVPALLSVLSLACSLSFLAGFHLFHGSAERLITESGATPRLSVFIHQDASMEDEESIHSEMSKWPETREIRLSRRLPLTRDGRGPRGLLEEAIDGVWIESAGTRIEVLLASDANPGAGIDGMLERLKRFPRITGVLDDRARLERLEILQGFLTSLGTWTVGLLAFLCLFTAAACSASTLNGDAEEIEVCLLLGGSRLQAFLPLYGRAVLVGLAAGAVSSVGVLFLLGSVRWLLPRMTLVVAEWAHWERPLLFIAMAMSGAVLSCLGCWCSLWYAKHCGAISTRVASRRSSPAAGRAW